MNQYIFLCQTQKGEQQENKHEIDDQTKNSLIKSLLTRQRKNHHIH